ncbi:aminotransferase class I/II-fold pyridoxal phosphate-dependent enzyme [Streptomyces sp. NPDC047017]|uniref:aminotransferase class I/II-fold pyridoxal phosphate-dependent enzyme n=1 Tax=Streptomyces sp. NPDC047017 TaxID=3155024 RepID=UPI0033EAD85D
MAGDVTPLFRTPEPLDFRGPGNPYFLTPALAAELTCRLPGLLAARPAGAEAAVATLCDLLGLPPQCVAAGNGSSELAAWIDHLLVPGSYAVPVPAAGRWTARPLRTGRRVDMFPLQESCGFALDLARYTEFIRSRDASAAVVCTPNDPDGHALTRHALVRFMDDLADLDLLVIDESHLEFADPGDGDPSVVQDAVLRPNVVVLRSLGTGLGLPGARLGHLVANPALTARVRAALPERNLNSLAEHLIRLVHQHTAAYRQSTALVRRDRRDMAARLRTLPGLTVYPSHSNFLLVRLPVGAEGTLVRDRLFAEHGVLVRECGDRIGSSSRFLRLAVRPEPDVRHLVSALAQVLLAPGYSSGTAAVDRLVSETNGAGLRVG